jgi:hypothetical protein
MKIKTGPESHNSPQWLHRQPSATVLKLDINGPIEGPQVADRTD